MDYSQSKYQIITSKLNFFALLLFVFWLPMDSDYFPAIISFWMFTWLLEGNIKSKFLSFQYDKKSYPVFILYFLLIIVALFFSYDLEDGLMNIQKNLSLLFFPIILAGSNKLIIKHYKTILLVFVFANFIASIYCLSNAFFSNLIIENGGWYIKYWHWNGTEKYSFFELIGMRYSNFSGIFLSSFMHPSYFSMYLVFSITIIVDLFRKKFISNKWLKIFCIFSVVLFALMIYLLQSRAGFLAFLAVTIFIIILEIVRKRKKRLLLIGLIVIALSSIFIFTNPRMQKVSNQFVELLKDPYHKKLNDRDARFQTMFAATQIIKENFWFGVTPSNLTLELVKMYEKYGFEDAQKEGLNAHNQYLETFAGLGIFGFISLIFILIYGFVYSYKKRHYLLFFLLLILSINFLFESMMERMAGILFMMFFYSLFVFMENKPIKMEQLNTLK